MYIGLVAILDKSLNLSKHLTTPRRPYDHYNYYTLPWDPSQ